MASFKMYLTAVFASILGTLISSEAQSLVPVLLWESRNVGESGLSPTGLSKMSVDEFADVLIRRVDRNPVVVLFAEDTLSVEDFSRQSPSIRSSFPALKSMQGDVRLEFIPAVQTPAKALNRLSELGYKWETLSGEVRPEAGKKIILVNLSDMKDDEDRSAMLLRHDKYIASLFKQMVAQYSDVLAVYTGRHSSWIEPETHRVRRDVDPTSAPSDSCNAVLSSVGSPDKVLLYTSECPILRINGTDYNLTSAVPQKADTRKTSTRMVVRYKVENTANIVTVRYRFNYTDNGFWELNQAEYEEPDPVRKFVLESKSNIRAPLNSSYSCGSRAIFEGENGTVSLTLRNIKVQPGVQGEVFADSCYDCVPFFTIPIWSGLFVTFLLLFIIAWGIDMMMNIHTMDRFDDPKGKQLVFNAQE